MTQSGIRYATKADIPRIHQLIKDLAEYERAPLEAKATIEQIEETKANKIQIPKIIFLLFKSFAIIILIFF